MTGDTQHGTILVVDDNLDIRAFTQRFLETAGWAVVTAADGAEGLRVYEEQRSNIVLLLTDVMMPNVNGLELAAHVLGMDSQLPVLLMSGEAGSGYPGLECIAKPFRSADLLDGIGRALNANAHSKTTASAA